MNKHRSAIAIVLLLFLAGPGHAHPLAPVLLELVQADGTAWDVRWKTSVYRPAGPAIEPRLPDCRMTGSPAANADESSVTTTWRAVCEPADLIGTRIVVDGLAASGINVIVRIARADGSVSQHLLHRDEPEIVVEAPPTSLEIGWQYATMGVEHILAGFDHLILVFGLLLLANGARSLVSMVTAFTVGHSVTLAAAVLGTARLSPGPVEFLIALSVFLLAVEIAAERERSLLRRFPAGVALAFGLLHGLGFAGALREVGLPQGEIPLALFAFNVGIEVGQLIFVAVCLGLYAGWRSAGLAMPSVLRSGAVHAMGGLAAFWCIERGLVLWR